MPELWEVGEEYREPGGSLQIVSGDVDITFLRGAPTFISDYSSGDPFGDASLSFLLPQVTSFDAVGAGDLNVLRKWTNVELYYLPPDFPASEKLTLWEGFIVTYMRDNQGLNVQCLGSLYQADNIVKKPRFYTEVQKHEDLIRWAFPGQGGPAGGQPDSRLAPFRIEWPVGWSKQDDDGKNITGHNTRNHGAWEKVLTGYIQDLLATMLTDDGRQWTLMSEPGRIPVLRVKDLETVDWTISIAQRGVDGSFTHDMQQSVNIIFGQGQDQAGSTWRNSEIRSNATYYEPLAYDRAVYPWERDVNEALDLDTMQVQAFYNFGSGVTQRDAMRDSYKMILRDRDPGWFGNIQLQIDPEEGSRLLIKAGDNIRIRYFNGTGRDGLIFHVAECVTKPEDGIVSLKVDSKARDLLTLSEIEERNRDSRTPSRLLQVNTRSHVVEDRYQPWDYSAGSGFIPTASKDLGHELRGPLEGQSFPYTYYTTRYPPISNPEYYVKVDGNSAAKRDRWTIVKILASERIIIESAELCAYDEYGQVLPTPFHWSVYFTRVFPADMPRDREGGEPDPFTEDAFDASHPEDTWVHPHPDMIIGWGDHDQRAGYWPGLESRGDPLTGMFRDEGTWQHQMPRGYYEIYVAIYALADAWFMGRLYRGYES